MLTIILSSLIAMSANAQNGQKLAPQAPNQEKQVRNRNIQNQSRNQKPQLQIVGQQTVVDTQAERFSTYRKTEGGYPLSPVKLPPQADTRTVIPSKGARGSHVNWGMLNGMGYCFEWTNFGKVLNGGEPIDNALCNEKVESYFDWAWGENGYGYCYQFSPDGYVLNNGQKALENFCEVPGNKSYYTWDQSDANGQWYCYRKTGNDILMNLGRPYSNDMCRDEKTAEDYIK